MTPTADSERIIKAECDECRTTAEALALGFDPVESGEWSDLVESCSNPDCRWYVPQNDGSGT